MADVFLSYSSKDRVRAQALAELLNKKAGISVFFDRSSIEAGANWIEVINKELQQAKAVIVFWSKNSIKSKWVIKEATVALSYGKLVPAIIEIDVDIPLEFNHIQTVNLTFSDFSQADIEIDNLLSALSKLLGSHIYHGRNLSMEYSELPEPQQQITLIPDNWMKFTDTKILVLFLHASMLTKMIVSDILNIPVSDAEHHLERLERIGYIKQTECPREFLSRFIEHVKKRLDNGATKEQAIAEFTTKDTAPAKSDNPVYETTEKGKEWLARGVTNPGPSSSSIRSMILKPPSNI